MIKPTALTQAILEHLENRADRKGDPFDLRGDRVTVRCFNPDQHKHGDANPSAFYKLDQYVFCPVCEFKLGQRRLANYLGIGDFENGLTLSELAEAKHLPERFLAQHDWRTQKARSSYSAVYIPWLDITGVERLALHKRHYVDKGDGEGPRFTWDKPKHTKLMPYGAWRHREWLDGFRETNIDSYIWLCESETDAVTFWLHDIPADAYGGAEFWRKEWASLYDGFSHISICAEPDPAGEAAARKIAIQLHEEIPDAQICVVPFPEEWKDANGLHQSVDGDSIRFQNELTRLTQNAIPVSEIMTAEEAEASRHRAEERQHDIEISNGLLNDPAIFAKAIDAIQALGVAGERRTIGTIRLAVRSRSLKRPANLEFNSPPSSGKTHIITETLRLEDPEAYYELTATSERGLIYLEKSLEHRMIFMQEPEGLAEGVGSAVIKSLTWEGRIRYDTVARESGKQVGQHIEKEGPTGLIVATTRSLDDQLSNRLLRIEADTSEDQTRKILRLLARQANGQLPDVEVTPWHAVSRVLGEEVEVFIPFSEWLSDLIATTAHRIRRDFSHLLTLIKASAIEHSFQRQTSSGGQIIATVADYAIVHALVGGVFQAVQAEGVTQPDRDMVAAVAELTEVSSGLSERKPVSQAAIVDHTMLTKATVSYRVNRLLNTGYLSNLETKKGVAHKLVLGAPLPDQAQSLPNPCDLSKYLFGIGRTDLIVPWIDPISSNDHSCFEHLEPSNSQPTTQGSKLEDSSGRASNPRRTPGIGNQQFGEGSNGGPNSQIGVVEPDPHSSSKVRAVREELDDDEGEV